MMQTKEPRNTSLQTAISAIESLDLTAVRLRMMDCESGAGWSEAHATTVEAAYRRFLAKVAEDPDHVEELRIVKDVDDFWHAHILHTKQYARDCEAVFGCFLHHSPEPRAGDGAVAREAAYCGAALEQQPAYCGAALDKE